MMPSRRVDRAWKHASLHLALLAVSVCMLLPFYWVLKTSLTGENIFVYPPSVIPVNPQPFYYVDVWYFIPFPRYLLYFSPGCFFFNDRS